MSDFVNFHVVQGQCKVSIILLSHVRSYLWQYFPTILFPSCLFVWCTRCSGIHFRSAVHILPYFLFYFIFPSGYHPSHKRLSRPQAINISIWFQYFCFPLNVCYLFGYILITLVLEIQKSTWHIDIKTLCRLHEVEESGFM